MEPKIARPHVGECGGPFHTCGSDDHCGWSLWNDCEPSNRSSTLLRTAVFGGSASSSVFSQGRVPLLPKLAT